MINVTVYENIRIDQRFLLKLIYFFAGPLAQWSEQATHNRLVAGSNPAGATVKYLLICQFEWQNVSYLYFFLSHHNILIFENI